LRKPPLRRRIVRNVVHFKRNSYARMVIIDLSGSYAYEGTLMRHFASEWPDHFAQVVRGLALFKLPRSLLGLEEDRLIIILL